MTVPVDPYRRIAAWIREGGRAGTVAFSGAGTSAESGIDTFRDQGGIWDRYDPAEVGTPAGIVGLWRSNPERLGIFIEELVAGFRDARPHAGHRALAEMERRGWLRAVITQNVDNLHQEAGNRSVIEVHGSLIRHRCLQCGRMAHLSVAEVFAYAERLAAALKGGFADRGLLPDCPACGGLLRPDIVLFTEPVPAVAEALGVARMATVVLVAGTSGVVEPAAGIPWEARRAGARLIDINPGGSAYSEAADIWLREPASVAFPRILDALGE